MMLSVIIPTYNRKASLARCLDALEAQAPGGPRFEVVIVDDGSGDGTGEMIGARRPGRADLRYFRIGHKGPAAVRNEGIRQARGELLLFIGDDILAGPRLIEEHLKWHGANPGAETAVFGHVTWSPELRVTPFMYWLEHGGPGFRYYQFRHGEPVDVLWTCNISFKKDFLVKNGGFFDEDFPYAAMEDIELGHRLGAKGLKILFDRDAAAWHFHPTDIVKYCVRQFLAGRSTRLFWEKHPGERRALAVLPGWKAALMSLAPVMKWAVRLLDAAGLRLDPRIYDLILEHYYRKGLGADPAQVPAGS